jgi:hypothetical protein
MPRAFTNTTPDTVLESFRRLMAEAEAPRDLPGAGGAETGALQEFRSLARDTPRHQAADPARASVDAPPVSTDAPVRDSGQFIDKIASRMAFPGEHDAAPAGEMRTSASRPEPPMVLTSPIVPPDDPTDAERNACAGLLQAAPVPEGPKLCKLLLTEDFLVRAPERTRVPHPVAPLAGVDYVEDSDLALGSDADIDMTPAAAALRDSVGRALRSALHTEMGAILGAGDTPPEAVSGAAALIDEDGHIDAETLRRLVAGIVRDELRGELGDDISRRIRKLVRLEINRMLQVRALD